MADKEISISAATRAAGKIKLTCAEPGEWQFSIVAEQGAAEEARISLDSPEEAFPPKFEVVFSVPQGDVRHIWHPGAEHGFVPPDWDGRGHLRTSIATGMPIIALVGLNDANRLTVVCSEASRVLDTKAGIVEESGEVRFEIGFFNAPEAPLRHYEATLRFDASPRFFAEAVREASAWLSARPGYAPCVAPPAAFEPLYSSWYAFHQDLFAAELEAECAEAAKDGMRAIILDDGWQTDDNSRGYAFCGDWEVSRRRFPDGMAAHVARVHALGMKYIVWYSVPFVGHKSRNYARFRGKFLSDIPHLHASVLDPRFREVRDFLAGTYESALREWDIDGFKLDFIDSFRFNGEDPAAKENFAGRDIRSLPEAVDALLSDIMRRLRAIKPDILIEFRQSYIGPAIRAYGNMIRAGDCPADSCANRIRIANLRLTSGATAVHSDMLMWHPTATPEEAAQQVLASLFGVIQYSMRLGTLPPEHHAMMRHWIAFTQEHREALLHGDFRPHGPAECYTILEGSTADEAVFAVYAENTTCVVAQPKATVIVVNATGHDSLCLDLAAAPDSAEAFDTFGASAGMPALAAGIQRVAVPPSGYIRLRFSAGLLPSGRIVVGANYWASHAATQMWRKWDAKAVEEDLRVLSAAGIRMLRVFPNWADFQPIHACFLSGNNCRKVRETRMFDSEEPLPDTPCGRAGVDERMVERFEAFCDMADAFGIRLIVPLLTGQMTFRNYTPPALANLDPFSDPYALMWEGRYLECMVTRLKAKRAIVAWESGNEACVLGENRGPATSEAWLRYVHQTIRCADPSRPVIGVNGLFVPEDADWPSSMNGSLSDFVTTHPYGFWGDVYNDDFNSVRSLTFAAAQTLALGQVAGKPAFVEEHGARRQEQTSQGGVARYMRGMLWNLWAVDARAMLWWCAYDQTGQTIAPYNWREPCVELGLFKRDRSPYPAAAALGKFAAMQKSLPFAALPKAKPDAVVISADENVIHSSFVLARQAGIFPAFASPEKPLPAADCYFLPDALGRAFMPLERWEELKAKVRDGAILYLSWNDTFLDSMEEVAGVEVAFREKRAGTDRCDFGGFAVEFPYAVKRRFNALTAETLAVNKDGEGVFFRNRYGKGTVYLCIHNFEKTLYQGAGGYEGDAWRIWAKVRPVERLVETGDKNVFASEHDFDDGRVGVVVVNNASADYDGEIAIRDGWRVASTLADDPAAAQFGPGNRLALSANAGILLMLEGTDC
ncbi:MAG: alpha-galactosidase [Kiritimatiellae bacterium]|nr:alpha-galactosidase [Kiritimatiellia bacterium]